jgi:hypothetical protein
VVLREEPDRQVMDRQHGWRRTKEGRRIVQSVKQIDMLALIEEVEPRPNR